MFLYRGQMVVNAQIGNMQAAIRYYILATDMAPAQAAIIRSELQSEKLDFNLTRP